MKASLKNYQQSPRKVRLVANLISGKRVADAEVALEVLPKRASLPILKLLQSAVSNALQKGTASKESLVISSVRVDKGLVMKRFMPRAFGRASRINKRTSHVLLVLKEVEPKIKKTKTAKASPSKPAKKTKAKAIK